MHDKGTEIRPTQQMGEEKGLAADLLNAAATGLAAGAGSALGSKLGQGKNPPPEKKDS
jgi:hypothetical protein